MKEIRGGAAIAHALRAGMREGYPALVAFLTAGYPSKERFAETLIAVAAAADVIEIGVPFTDPMADGVTIQRASALALAEGVDLAFIFETLAGLRERLKTPVLLMSYLNPLLAPGFTGLATAARRSGVSGLIVPDLPLEESVSLKDALNAEGLALVQLVTPVTPDARLQRLCKASQGFVYAVTVTGITGGQTASATARDAYLARVRDHSSLPVCAGFGIREMTQVDALAGQVEGVIVGSALVEALERGEDPRAFLKSLRGGDRP